MKTPVIAILRHADYQQPAGVPSAWLPYPLNEKGVAEALSAVQMIQAFQHAESLALAMSIDSSRMLRAWQTAGILAEGLGIGEVRQFDALAERSVGAAANLTTAQIESLLAVDPRFESPPQGWKSSTDYCLPFQGAESLEVAGRRVAEHIESAATVLQPATLKVIVGHGASLRHAAMHLGILTRDNVGSVSMYHARPVFLVRENGQWLKVAGDWKPRKTSSDSDEFNSP